MNVTATDVKRLRDTTGAGMMDCKRALVEASGDVDAAVTVLREKGLASAEKRKGRVATDGLVYAYLHTPSPGLPARVGVMVELATETDFVAKTTDIRELAHEIALHIAAAKPAYLTEEDVPIDVLDQQRAEVADKVRGKRPDVVEKAMQGAVRKLVETSCLLEQRWIRDETQTVRQLIAGVGARVGENVGVRRFVRYEIEREGVGAIAFV